MTENLQCKHGHPSHHPIDNKTGRTEEAAERCAECKVQQREEALELCEKYVHTPSEWTH